MSVESAYPDRLLTYASSAKGGSTALTRAGTNLSTAIQDFLATHPDPQVISGVTDWGQELTTYAGRRSQIDQWVHDVGVAFQTADNGRSSRPVTVGDGPIPVEQAPTAAHSPLSPLPVSPAVTIPAIVARQKLQTQQQLLQEEQDCTAPGNWGPLGYVPYPDPGPQATAAAPGELQRATQQNENRQGFWSWMGGNNLPDDPHVPDGTDPTTEEQTLKSGGPPPVQYPVGGSDAAGGE